ncbi:MAG: hypothetical protein ACP6IP_08010 [Candidatus Njordarchaeia archaeon]
MTERVSFIQRRLEQLIKVAIPPHPIDVGKFTVKALERAILEAKDELGYDFDRVVVYPGAQPRESSDVELIKNGETVARINLKTAVSGDLKVALRKLARSLRGKETGAVAFFALFYKNDDVADTKLVIALIPGEVFDYYEISDIYDAILLKVDEKIRKKNYVRMEILAVNEAIEFIRAYEAIVARETAEEAREEAKKAREVAEEAREEAKKANSGISQIHDILREILKRLEGR